MTFAQWTPVIVWTLIQWYAANTQHQYCSHYHLLWNLEWIYWYFSLVSRDIIMMSFLFLFPDVCFDGQSVPKVSNDEVSTGPLIPMDSLITSQKLSTPPILRGRKKSRRSGLGDSSMNDSSLTDQSHTTEFIKHEPLSTPKCENKNSSLHTPKPEPKTPIRSPLKDLPFSPSAFLNSPDTRGCAPPGNLTSTPVCKSTQNTPGDGDDSGMHTPKIKVEDDTE